MLKTLENIFLGFLFACLPLAFLPSLEDAYRRPQLACLALSLLGLAATRAVQGQAFQLKKADLWVGLFFLWRLITHFKAGWVWQPAWVLEQGLYFGAYLIFSQPLEMEMLRRLRFFLLLGLGLAAAYGILQSFGLDPLAGQAQPNGFGQRAYSSLGNPDFWGGLLVLGLPFSLVYWLQEDRAKPVLFSSLVLGLLLLSLLLSQTRGAWLAFGFSFVYLVIQQRRKILNQRLVWLVSLGLACFVLFSFKNPLNRQGLSSAQRLFSSFSSSQADAQGRFFMTKIAFQIFRQHPWMGAGAGHFTEAFLQEQGRALQKSLTQAYLFTQDAHNDWLQVAAESGLPALALLLVFYLGALWRLRKNAGPLAGALGMGLAALGLHACFHFPLDIVPSAAFFWCFLGLAQHVEVRSVQAAPGTGTSSRQVYVALVLICGLASVLFIRTIFSNAFFHQGMNFSVAGQPQSAIPFFQKASLLEKKDYRIWFEAGRAYEQAGNLEAASQNYKKSLELLPTYPEAWANLGLVWGKAGRLRDAEQACLQALSLNANSSAAWGNLGKIHYLEGKVEEARTDYLTGIQRQPSWGQGYDSLAVIDFNQRNFKKVREDVKAALSLNPQDSFALDLQKKLPK